MSRKRIKRECPLCKEGLVVDYKNTELLKKYLSRFNKITPRIYTGVCKKHQTELALAIKRARYMALLPYTVASRHA